MKRQIYTIIPTDLFNVTSEADGTSTIVMNTYIMCVYTTFLATLIFFNKPPPISKPSPKHPWAYMCLYVLKFQYHVTQTHTHVHTRTHTHTHTHTPPGCQKWRHSILGNSLLPLAAQRTEPLPQLNSGHPEGDCISHLCIVWNIRAFCTQTHVLDNPKFQPSQGVTLSPVNVRKHALSLHQPIWMSFLSTSAMRVPSQTSPLNSPVLGNFAESSDTRTKRAIYLWNVKYIQINTIIQYHIYLT